MNEQPEHDSSGADEVADTISSVIGGIFKLLFFVFVFLPVLWYLLTGGSLRDPGQWARNNPAPPPQVQPFSR